MVERTGRFQVLFLVDTNTGVEMFESAEIVEYLEDVYIVKEGEQMKHGTALAHISCISVLSCETSSKNVIFLIFVGF